MWVQIWCMWGRSLVFFLRIQRWFFCLCFRERLRTHSIESSGKLKISPEQHWDFTAEDLKDLGEIGRGAYGSVNKMVHKPSGQIMAVKVSVMSSESPVYFIPSADALEQLIYKQYIKQHKQLQVKRVIFLWVWWEKKLDFFCQFVLFEGTWVYEFSYDTLKHNNISSWLSVK